jgi:hypothetical protein
MFSKLLLRFDHRFFENKGNIMYLLLIKSFKIKAKKILNYFNFSYLIKIIYLYTKNIVLYNQ